MYGPGFVISGRKIEQAFGECRIESMVNKNNETYVRIACGNSIGSLGQQVVPFRWISEDVAERFFQALEGMTLQYQRCRAPN